MKTYIRRQTLLGHKYWEIRVLGHYIHTRGFYRAKFWQQLSINVRKAANERH